MFLITKDFTFDAAHYLPLYKGKCENLHGHTYKMAITVQCKTLKDGIAFDFVELNRIVKEEIINLWDHRLVNDSIENPSAENMCIYVWQKLAAPKFLGKALYEVKIWETATAAASFRGGKSF